MHREPSLRSCSQVTDTTLFISDHITMVECTVVCNDLEIKFFVISHILINSYYVDLIHIAALKYKIHKSMTGAENILILFTLLKGIS